MLKAGLNLILTPLALVWSLVYGVLGGMFFKLLAVGEHLRAQNRLQIMTWKRYPQRSSRHYADSILEQKMQHKNVNALIFAYHQVHSTTDRSPFPVLPIFSNTLVALLWLPFALVSGAVQGPRIAYGNFRRHEAAVLRQAQR